MSAAFDIQLIAAMICRKVNRGRWQPIAVVPLMLDESDNPLRVPQGLTRVFPEEDPFTLPIEDIFRLVDPNVPAFPSLLGLPSCRVIFSPYRPNACKAPL